MSDPQAIRTAVYEFLNELKPGLASPDDSESDELRLDMLIDSFDMYSLIEFLESQFNIEVKDDEAGAENLGSIGTVVQFVTEKQKIHS